MDNNLVINANVTSAGQGVNVAQGIYKSGQTVNQTLVLTPGQQYASPIGFSALTISVLSGGPIQLTTTVESNITSQLINSLTVIDNPVDSFIVLNPVTNTASAGVQLSYVAFTGTNPPTPSIVTSVDGQTGDVVVSAVSGNTATGYSLVMDSGATTGTLKFVNLVAGTNTTITPDANGNLQISSSGGGSAAVTSVDGQTGDVIVDAVDNNPATGTTLIADSGATTGSIKLKTVVAGTGISLSSDTNGNLEISGASQYILPPATGVALGGVIASGAGVAIDGSGNLSNTGVLSVNTHSGAVTLTSTDVGIPTDLLSGTGGTLSSKYVPASLLGAVSYQGTWNAATNTPQILTGSASSSNKGFYHAVSVAGATTVDGTSAWNVGDWIISDGTIWARLQVSQTISTVNGMTGEVVVYASDNSDASGVSLISNGGATTGDIKLKTLVAGTGIALSSDMNGNLVIAGGGYNLPAATTTSLGGVIVGSGLTVSGGTISVSALNLVSAGVGISISSAGVISASIQTIAGVAPVAGNVPLTVSNITGAAPLVSPSFMGRNQYTADSFVASNLGSISGTQTLNLQSATQFIATIAGNTTFGFSNPPTAGVNQVTLLKLTNAGASTIVWPASTVFVAGKAPTFTTAGVDMVGVLYDSASAVYMVFVIGLNLLT